MERPRLSWHLNHAGRSSGLAKEQVTADYLQGLFQGYGYSVSQQPFNTTDYQGNPISSQKVVAVKPGTSGKQIIIGAHYDTALSSAHSNPNCNGLLTKHF